MKISYNWLRNYLNKEVDLSAQEMSELLTGCGLEVETVEEYESVKGGLKGAVVGEVLTCVKHPDADKLSITTVNVGTAEPLNIVCGAPNVAAGQKVAVATIGTTLYNGDEPWTIKKSKIRGALSEGMICAEDELGLGKSHDGIMVLPAEIPIGTAVATLFKIENDHVFEIGLTPNRSDATSHIGVARDIAAVINAKSNSDAFMLKYPDISGFKADGNAFSIAVEVADTKACPRYSSLTVENVVVKESPEWLKNKLLSIGLRPVNNIVDITNFILIEYGQPLHAFDADRIKGRKVIVKQCPKGTPFVTLDGVKRELDDADLMICNAEEPMCIAGVFGGEKSGVTEKTTNIFLESAYFNPVNIRKTAKRHGLKTDASFRYERGCDPNITLTAIKRAAMLIKEIAGGSISEINDIYPEVIKKQEVVIAFRKLNNLIGKNIPEKEVLDILRSLEIEVKTNNGDELTLLVPTNKCDVTRDVDIVEEILRIYGYNNVEMPGILRSSYALTQKPDKEKLYQRIANMLVGNGFFEIMNNSLTKELHAQKVPGFDIQKSVHILNPLSNELNVMRQSLLFGGLEAVVFNQNRKNTDLKFFELGNIYELAAVHKEESVIRRFREEQHLSLIITGNKNAETWETAMLPVNLFMLKNLVHMILSSLRLEKIELTHNVAPYFSEGLSYFINQKEIVQFGKIHSSVNKYFDVKHDVYYADFNWNNVLKCLPKDDILYKEVSKFPDVRRDLALLIDKNIEFEQIRKIAFQAEKKLLKEVNLFDVYEGDKLPEGKKSYAVSFILMDEEKTLTDKQIEKVMEKLMQEFAQQLNATLR